MSSHNSAIASRTSCGEFTVTIHRYISVGRLCCTRSLILNNASLPSLCMIIHGKPEVGSVSQSSIIFASRIIRFTFPCGCISELTAWTLCICLWKFAVFAWWMDTVAHRVYITQKESLTNLFDFKYHNDLALPKYSSYRITNGLCGICLSDHLHSER